MALSAPTRRYLSNTTGAWITATQATDPAYWVSHLRQTVRARAPARERLEQGHRRPGAKPAGTVPADRANWNGHRGEHGRLGLPGLHDRVGVQRDGHDAFGRQPVGEVRVVAGPLAADAHVLADGAAGRDGTRDQRFDGRGARGEVAR